ncbi:MAG: 30S ribosomal protein S6e, partial [Methanomicrobia archaeon]|nr:30S ribosomal protein S6e [Methanomicrobia archaeon]
MEVKIVVSYPDGKSEQKELRDEKANSLLGKKIGDIIEGSMLDVKGDLLITGGSDKDGFAMRKDIDGPIRKKILLSRSIGFKPKRDGERRKKRVRGNMITDEIIQINTKVIAKPKKVTKKKEPEVKKEVPEEGPKEEKPKKAKKEV